MNKTAVKEISRHSNEQGKERKRKKEKERGRERKRDGEIPIWNEDEDIRSHPLWMLIQSKTALFDSRRLSHNDFSFEKAFHLYPSPSLSLSLSFLPLCLFFSPSLPSFLPIAFASGNDCLHWKSISQWVDCNNNLCNVVERAPIFPSFQSYNKVLRQSTINALHHQRCCIKMTFFKT